MRKGCTTLTLKKYRTHKTSWKKYRTKPKTNLAQPQGQKKYPAQKNVCVCLFNYKGFKEFYNNYNKIIMVICSNLNNCKTRIITHLNENTDQIKIWRPTIVLDWPVSCSNTIEFSHERKVSQWRSYSSWLPYFDSLFVLLRILKNLVKMHCKNRFPFYPNQFCRNAGPVSNPTNIELTWGEGGGVMRAPHLMFGAKKKSSLVPNAWLCYSRYCVTGCSHSGLLKNYLSMEMIV